ncbi:MAG: flagellar hook assembly protein FlgD [Wenzhouxiangella sp.]|jgi:flagellar basal-body rod modification protein FlgD|nr:flagellar hook assembly protein FlgD [Wenzhouxiangella sp.]
MDLSGISGIRQFTDPSAMRGNVDNELGQEEFLSLMIAQLRNQDPFKPMENGDFLGQMAQFSTVSGIGELKESFEATARSLQGGQALQAASLVDRNALIRSDQIAFDGENSATGAFSVPPGALEAHVDVRDGTGALIRRVPATIGADGRATFSWDGFDADGTLRAADSYAISASVRVGSQMQAAETLVWGRIESVTLGTADDGSAVLNIAGIGSVPLSQAREIS